LIKELNASKGYLGDANINAWSNTVEKVKSEFVDVMIVVPGHGKYGNSKLLDYTINLFKK
jgi:metallo-beta-lactamase class B